MNLRICTLACLGIFASAVPVVSIPATVARSSDAPLVLETKIPLGEVRGRIDHLTVDLARQRLL
jgi:hypothetical protein